MKNVIRFLLIFLIIGGSISTIQGQPNFALTGYAGVNGVTTGGAGGTTVTVTTGSALDDAIQNKGSAPLTIYVSGRLTFSDGRVVIKDLSDISIIGQGNSAELDGFGITMRRASNIIIRNLKIHHVSSSDKDAIQLTDNTHHVWVDHCELYSDLNHGKDYYDGLLDISHASDYVTVSWNRFYNHFKVSLIGHSDNNSSEDQGHFRVTYHHNWFSNLNSRLPSNRFGQIHLYNNLYENIYDRDPRDAGTAISSRMGAVTRIERNWFSDVKTPILTDQSDVRGYVQLVDNRFVNCGSYATSPSGTLNVPYSYTSDPVDDVPSIVTAYSGVGMLDPSVTPGPTSTPWYTPTPTHVQAATGDVNGDGAVTIVDALMIAQYSVGYSPQGFNPDAADVNGDNHINIVDALMAAQIYVGVLTPGPTNTPVITPAPTGTGPVTGAVYIAPYGSASASGTISDPTTLAVAITRIQPGEQIIARGGVYTLSTTITIDRSNCGTSGAYKQLISYPGEQAVFNFSPMAENSTNRGIALNGNWWLFSDIVVEEAGDNGIFVSGNNNIIQYCITRKNHDTGLQLSRTDSTYTSIDQWPSNNLIFQCESYDNADSDSEDADGFAAKLTCGTGNIFRGCVSHNNIDDGWDLYTKTATGPIGAVTLEYCIAYGNGVLTNGSTSGNGDKNGFKLGGENIPVNHTVKNCIAYNNGKHGFTYNRNLGTMLIKNCAAYGNAQRNFNFDGGTSTFINNLSYESGDTDRIIGGELNPGYNCWWDDSDGTINARGLQVSSGDFISLSLGTIRFNQDGTLDLGSFLALSSSSDLRNAGMSGENIGPF